MTFSGGGEEEMKYWGEMSLWQHLFQITNKDNFVDFKTMTRSVQNVQTRLQYPAGNGARFLTCLTILWI